MTGNNGSGVEVPLDLSAEVFEEDAPGIDEVVTEVVDTTDTTETDEDFSKYFQVFLGKGADLDEIKVILQSAKDAGHDKVMGTVVDSKDPEPVSLDSLEQYLKFREQVRDKKSHEAWERQMLTRTSGKGKRSRNHMGLNVGAIRKNRRKVKKASRRKNR